MSEDADMNTFGIFGALWRYRWWIILPVAVAAIASVIFVLVETPRYQATAQVLIERQETSFTRPEGETTLGNTQFDQEAVASEVQVIKSVDIAKRVIREQNLADLEEFNPEPDAPGLIDLVKSLFGSGSSADKTEQYVLLRFRKHLDVYALTDSRVINIEFWSEDPELATRIVNAIADAYIDFQKAAVVETTTEASTWLERQIADLRQRVSGAEQRVEDFRARNNLFNSSSGTGAADNRPATLMSQELTELSSQLTQARAQRSDAQARARMINELLDSGRSIESRDVFDSAIVLRLQEERARVRAQIAELSSTLLPAHPRMLELNAQRESIERQIRTEAERLVRGLENDAAVAAAREREIMISLDGLKQSAANSNEAEVQLRALEREATAQRQLLESYLTRFREAAGRTATELTPSRARIISRATVPPRPYYPSKKLIPVLAVVGTAILTSAAVLTLELARMYASQPLGAMGYGIHGVPVQPVNAAVGRLDAGRREPSLDYGDDLEQPDSRQSPDPLARLNRQNNGGNQPLDGDDPVFSDIAPVANDTNGFGDASEQGQSSQSKVHAVWRPRVSERLVMFAGLTRGSAAIDALVARLRDISDEGQQVLAVDLRPGAPLVMSATGKSKLPGFHDILHGQSSFEEAIFGDPLSRMNVMGSGQSVLAANLSNAEPMFEALTAAYDLVAMISAPFSRVPWQVNLAQSCDMVALAAGRHDANTPEVKRLLKRLENDGKTRVELYVDGTVEAAA
ncbi:MAG: GumC family protein [Pseudomonadota bacterium]